MSAKAVTSKIKIPARPAPPLFLLDKSEPYSITLPSPELLAWIRSTFIDSGGVLVNEHHKHLRVARIGVLWTNEGYVRQMMPIVGMAEIPKPPSTINAWGKQRWTQQMRAWFGPAELDFLLTFYAPYAAKVDDTSWCSTVEHELYHCAQKKKLGQPWFSKSTGRPVYAIKGHDVEEHVGVVERYGPGAGAGATAQLVAVANRPPLIGLAQVRAACGICIKQAA